VFLTSEHGQFLSRFSHKIELSASYSYSIFGQVAGIKSGFNKGDLSLYEK